MVRIEFGPHYTIITHNKEPPKIVLASIQAPFVPAAAESAVLVQGGGLVVHAADPMSVGGCRFV